MGFSFIQKSIKVEEGQVRLSISKQQYEYLRTIGVDAKFIYLKTKLFSNVNVKNRGLDVFCLINQAKRAVFARLLKKSRF